MAAKLFVQRGINSGGAFIWYFQRITAFLLLITLIAHFWVLHFFPAEGGVINYGNVMARLSSPWWKALDLTFLVCAIYHALNGLMIIVNDYLHNWRLRLVVVGVLWVGSLFYLIIGSVTILGLKG